MGRNIQDKSVRKWIFMLFIGPGLFFLFYWFIVQGTTETSPQNIDLPKEYYLPGQAVKVDSGEIKAGMPGVNVFTSELIIGNNNRVMAEPGKIFFVIPVISQNYNFQFHDFSLLDSSGVQYSSLEVDQQKLYRVIQKKEVKIPTGDPVNYLLFKVKKDVQGYYLIMKKGVKEVVWYFER